MQVQKNIYFFFPINLKYVSLCTGRVHRTPVVRPVHNLFVCGWSPFFSLSISCFLLDLFRSIFLMGFSGLIGNTQGGTIIIKSTKRHPQPSFVVSRKEKLLFAFVAGNMQNIFAPKCRRRTNESLCVFMF